MREMPNLRLDTCGFELLWSPCPISYEDFDDQQKIRDTYLANLSKSLKSTLGAKFVIPLDFCVRRRHESFPISTGKDYEYNQPTSMAHIDFTVHEGERIIHILFGDRAADILQSRWQIIKQDEFFGCMETHQWPAERLAFGALRHKNSRLRVRYDAWRRCVPQILHREHSDSLQYQSRLVLAAESDRR
ncbi:hypothetical protein PG985_003225 [Apiospora marii]|uniref:uncharacterized protein n=1 Tax=Apiospora marii TaxID=335849 RepID=UPI00312F5790